MSLKYMLIGVLIMAAVTYIPRVLPITIFRKKIKSKYIRSFLDYTPYAILGALTFPDIFSSTGHFLSAACGTLIALILAYFKRGLVEVAVAAIAVTYLVEILLGNSFLSVFPRTF